MTIGTNGIEHSRAESGQTATEFAVIVGFLAIALAIGILAFRTTIVDVFVRSGEEVGTFKPPIATCDSSYHGACIPKPPPKVTCDDLAGVDLSGVTVSGSDPQGLDPDGDGIVCN